MLRRWLSAALALAATTVDAATPYVSNGECAGLPRLALTTPPGFCVGLAAQGLKFPRGLLPLAGGAVLVADMGGWVPNRGRLVLLQPQEKGFSQRELLTGLDRPHGLALGPDGRIYVGEVGKISRLRLDPKTYAVSERADVVGGSSATPALPGDGRHPLRSVVFDRAGHLYVGIGSISDHCEASKAFPASAPAPCPEVQGAQAVAVIHRYTLRFPAGEVIERKILARGLRNAIALAIEPRTQALWQAENGRDNIHRAMQGLANDDELPPEELNLIIAERNYGWPYCYGNNSVSPEYPAHDCSRFAAPKMLLPAHAAPLGMSFYDASAFPSPWRGNLLLAYHGYRAHGHRLVALAMDANGNPVGPARAMISGWEKSSTGPMGTPVDVRVDSAGAVWISEDKNGTVLRLSYQ